MSTEPSFRRVPACVPWDLATNEQVTGGPALRIIQLAGITQPNKDLGDVKILDIGCGAGVVTSLIRQVSDQPSIVAVDNSEGMVTTVKERMKAEGWSNIQVEQMDMEAMTTIPDSHFDYIFGNMAYGFSPSITAALAESHRVLKPTGTLGFTTWPYVSWWPIAQAALRHHIPEAPPLPDPTIRSPSTFGKTIPKLKADLEDSGFGNVRIERFDFLVDCGSVEWARAAALLVRMVGKRVWSGKGEFEEYEGRVEDAMIKYVVEDLGYVERFTKEMTAFVTIAEKV